jgi:hypothetical protein
MASATGESSRVRRLSWADARRKSAEQRSVNQPTKLRESRPAGIARVAVRGLAASRVESAQRLKAMPAERARTMQMTIQKSCMGCGQPEAASMAPVRAKGRAKMLCSHLIISRVVRVLCQRDITPNDTKVRLATGLWERSAGARRVALRIDERIGRRGALAE